MTDEVNEVWTKLADAVADYVRKIKDSTGANYTIERKATTIRVVQSSRINTVSFTKHEKSDFVSVLCTGTELEGLRSGTFQIANGRFATEGDFCGEPKPGSNPMTVEEFSEFTLGPYFSRYHGEHRH